MPSPARDAALYRMTPAQAEWLALAGADGRLPRDWPSGRSGRQSRRRVDMRIVFGCLRQGWVLPQPRLMITEAGRAALASYGREQAVAPDRPSFLAAAHP
jgi:hypothetical protein